MPRRKLHEALYGTDGLTLNDEIPSRVAMLVRDLISYRNRVHVTEYMSCKKQTQKRGFVHVHVRTGRSQDVQTTTESGSVIKMKWGKLHCGPMWSGQEVLQGLTPTTSSHIIEEVYTHETSCAILRPNWCLCDFH